MKVFDLFVSQYPPDQDLRKPTAEMLEQFQGKLPESGGDGMGFVGGIDGSPFTFHNTYLGGKRYGFFQQAV